MQPSRRPQRLALQIQQEVSLLISRNMKDRRIGFVTVTGVRMSPDLRHAKIFISTMDDSEGGKAETLEILNNASGWIRRELGHKIRVKFLPDIVFLADYSQDYGEKIDRLIDEIHGHKDR
jgi:ribosome-binding factor A